MIDSPVVSRVPRRQRPPLVKNLLVGASASRLQIRRLREYALSFWSSLASIPVLMVVTYSAWRVVFGGRETVNGYTFLDIISYYFLLRLVSLVIWEAGSVAGTVWQDVNSGNLASYLARPLDYSLLSLGKCAGPALLNRGRRDVCGGGASLGPSGGVDPGPGSVFRGKRSRRLPDHIPDPIHSR
jgi:hypothetical protein